MSRAHGAMTTHNYPGQFPYPLRVYTYRSPAGLQESLAADALTSLDRLWEQPGRAPVFTDPSVLHMQ